MDLLLYLNWLLVVMGLGAMVLPLCWRLFADFPTRGVGYALPAGLLLVGVSGWVLPSLGLFPFGRPLLGGLVAIFVAAIWVCYGGSFLREWRLLARSDRWFILMPLLVGLGAALWQGYLTALNPSIFISEKPMNFAFINSITRASWFPPEDPWLAGHPLNYYYLGHLLFAALIELSGVERSTGFSLSAITLLALVTSTLFSLVLDVVGLQEREGERGGGWNRRAAIAAAMGAVALTLFCGNLVPIQQMLAEPSIAQSWLQAGEADWWQMPYHGHGRAGLSELPWRTFMLGYMHSSAIALLFFIVFCAWTLVPGRGVLWGVGLALLGAGTVLISPWFAPAILLVAALNVARDALATRRSGEARDGCRVYPLGGWGVAALMGLALLYLFGRTFQSPGILPRLSLESAGAIPFETFLLQQGVPLVAFALVMPRRLMALPRRWLWLLGASALLLAAIAAWTPVGLSAAASLFLWLCAIMVMGCIARRSGQIPPALALLASGLTLNLLPYLVTIHNSDETFYKFGFVAWMLVAAALFADVAIQHAEGQVGRGHAGVAAVVLGTVLLAGAMMPLLAAKSITGNFRGSGTLTLDSVNFYLQQSEPDESAAIQWLADHAASGERLVEATGAPYRTAGRVSALTGIPTIIGWGSHELLWHEGNAQRLSEIQQRTRDVDTLYRTMDDQQAACLLSRYGVTYLFVGRVERANTGPGGEVQPPWPSESLDKFARFMDVVYPPDGQVDEGGVVIYRTRPLAPTQTCAEQG